MQADDKRADHELTKIRTLVERCGVIVTERKSGRLFQGISLGSLTMAQPTLVRGVSSRTSTASLMILTLALLSVSQAYGCILT